MVNFVFSELLIYIIYPFFTGLHAFFLLIFRSSLYILNINTVFVLDHSAVIA